MQHLNVLFVGIGSIAKRHIKNLSSICENRDISLSIDCLRHSVNAKDVEIDTNIKKIYYDVSDVALWYDIIFITNPTSLHFETFLRFKDKSENFFIEKPLCDMKQYDCFFQKTQECTGKKIYVACPLRHTNVIQYIKENIDFSKVYSVRCISSSYLPDWRDGIDYRNTYSAHREMGGGVSTDLIHEWDYIYFLLGKPKAVKSIIKKVSDLEIDSDDIAIYIADYGDKTVELHLDYFGREAIRQIELFMKEDTIVGDILNSRIVYKKSGKEIDLAEGRNDFQKKELEHFLDIICGKTKNTNDLKKSIDVLKLTGGNIS